MANVSSDSSLLLANRLMSNIKVGGSDCTRELYFVASFGTTPTICSIVWKQIFEHVLQSMMPIDLLWALMFSWEIEYDENNA